MTERPILFNGEMMRAVLDGRKTQTRRVIKPQPADWAECISYNKYLGRWEMHGYEGGMSTSVLSFDGQKEIKCPYGQPGDKLWVRETWQHAPDGAISQWNYRADYSEEVASRSKWKPSIHMPREASRITLEITDIRVERVQEISEEDALAEGLEKSKTKVPGMGKLALTKQVRGEQQCTTPRNAFTALWNSINGKRGFGWDVNPWVWVVEFKRVEP